jgi:hypothetical protein
VRTSGRERSAKTIWDRLLRATIAFAKADQKSPVWFVEAMSGHHWLPLVFCSLADPTLFLFDHTGALIAANDNWKDTQQAQIQATGLAPRIISAPRF